MEHRHCYRLERDDLEIILTVPHDYIGPILKDRATQFFRTVFAELVERCTTPVEIALVHEDQRLLPLHGAVQLSHAICGEEVPGPARTVQV